MADLRGGGGGRQLDLKGHGNDTNFQFNFQISYSIRFSLEIRTICVPTDLNYFSPDITIKKRLNLMESDTLSEN
jgi:hypothetical protein